MEMFPVPLVAPIVLPEVVPTFTVPASMLMAVKIPGADETPLLVVKLIPLTLLF